MVYIAFAFSALLVILAGNRLAGYGDTLAAHTTLGHGLVGGILIAGVTSLPEFSSSISAAVIGSPDIAFGNVYGSNAFNLMILAIVDIAQGKGGLLQIVRESHILTAMFGILLTGFSVLAIWLTPYGFLEFQIGWVSSYSVVLMGLYIFAVIIMMRYEGKTRTQLDDEALDREIQETEMETDLPEKSLRHAITGFTAMAVIIVIAGITLSVMADKIALATGLGQTFVGTLLVAGATSLPELVASIAAIRIGAYDMAVGNVLGSNVFNIMILVVTDVAFFSGPVYKAVSMQHMITAVAGIILSSIAVIGLFYRSKRTVFTVGWDSLAIMMGYLVMMYALFVTSI